MVGLNSTLPVLIVQGFLLWKLADASTFLGASPTVAPEFVSASEVQASLLDEIRTSLGSGATDGRLIQMEDAIRSMYTAMPKNEHGKLGHASVRYALRRLFVQRNGWFVNGLGLAGGHRNSSSAVGILKERVPAYIQDIVEQRMSGHGLNLHELAVVASTIEHLVHSEAEGRLEAVFEYHGIPLGIRMSNDQALDALETYMMAYILGINLREMPHREIKARLKKMKKGATTYWPGTKEWVHKVHRETSIAKLPHELLDFDGVLRTADKLGEGYGRHNDAECQELKADMLKLEDKGTGRVLVSTFYKAALDGMWQFSESIDYLRDLGALDETRPQQPSVIVANYIGGVSNCVASSGFYSVCCLDECEGLLGHLEAKIASSHATTTHVLELVQAFLRPLCLRREASQTC